MSEFHYQVVRHKNLVLVERGGARAFSRRGLDWTARYPRIVAAAEALSCVSAIIDGEAVVQDEVGRSDLAAFHSYVDAEPHRVLLFAFDLLHLDGKDLRRESLEERRARLQALRKPDPLFRHPVQRSHRRRRPDRLCGSGAHGWRALSQSASAAATGAVPHATG